MRRQTPLLALVTLGVLACASPRQHGTRISPRDIITEEELASTNRAFAFDAILDLKRHWLRWFDRGRCLWAFINDHQHYN